MIVKEKVKFYHGTNWRSFCLMTLRGWQDVFFTDTYERAESYAIMNEEPMIIQVELELEFNSRKERNRYLKRRERGDFHDVLHSTDESTVCLGIYILQNKKLNKI